MRGDKVKTPVLGMVERKGRVIALAIPDTTAKTLCGTVREYVLPKSTVFTDELAAYQHGLRGTPLQASTDQSQLKSVRSREPSTRTRLKDSGA